MTDDLTISARSLRKSSGIETKNIPGNSIALDRLKIKSFINKRIKQAQAEYSWLFAILGSFVFAGSYFIIMLLDRFLIQDTVFSIGRAILTSGTIAIALFIFCNIILSISIRMAISKNSKNPKFSTLRGLIDDINAYNQAALTFSDQIKIVTISEQHHQKLALKKKALVLEKIKTKLLKSLKTERIIRNNPNFDPSSLASNMVTHNANELSKNASSYSAELASQIDISSGVEKEINSLIK